MAFPILIAEDSEDDRILFRYALEKACWKHPFHFVGDGEEAVEWLNRAVNRWDRAKNPVPSAVITDLKMPRKNGFELLGWIRSNPALSTLPVIVYSSSGDLGDIERALDLGATAYFRKSYAFVDIIQFLESLPMIS